MTLPNFLIIGVQKAGTTSIYNYLQEHPQIFMSQVKETNFLEKDWENLPPEKQNKNGIVTVEKYAELFRDVKDEKAIGEASPNYLFHYESSAARIKKYVPEAKLIVVLRNPVERAYSDYLMHLRDAIGYRSLSDQIKYSSHKSFILQKGFYYLPLKHYFEQFGRGQIQVFFYDDLCKDPQLFMQEMYKFLEVDAKFTPNTTKKAQIAKVPKNKTVNNLLQRKNMLRNTVAKIMKTVVPLETRQKLRDRLIELNSHAKKEVPLSKKERQQLIELYREDILNLQDLVERDLSSWLI